MQQTINLQVGADSTNIMQTMMQMLVEIRNQNLYLMERSLELEQIVNTEVRPLLEDGFLYLG